MRELMAGPRRFSDLRGALPGIATNLLAARLRQLQADGIIKRVELPPPAASTVYELTDVGEGLTEAVLGLVRWGGRWMEERDDDAFRPHWLVVALRALLPAEAPIGLTAEVDLLVDGSAVSVRAKGGGFDVGEGRSTDPDLVVETDATTILGLAARRLTMADAASSGRVRTHGDPEVFNLLLTGQIGGRSESRPR